MARGWTAAHIVALGGRYNTPNLANYQAIQRFFATEVQVRAILDEINLATAQINSTAGFETWLGVQEAAFGFSPNVVSILAGVIDSETFLSYLAAKRPMLDFGAGARHGFNTHRVQWVMVGLMAQHLNPFTESVVELYRQLGGSGFTRRVINSDNLVFGYLWDDLCDRLFQPNPSRNATCPEYLRDVYVEQEYPGLAAIWR